VLPKTCKILVANMHRVDKTWKRDVDRRTVSASNYHSHQVRDQYPIPGSIYLHHLSIYIVCKKKERKHHPRICHEGPEGE